MLITELNEDQNNVKETNQSSTTVTLMRKSRAAEINDLLID